VEYPIVVACPTAAPSRDGLPVGERGSQLLGPT